MPGERGSARRWVARLLLSTVLVVGAIGAGGGATYATWSAMQTWGGGTLTAGDLQVDVGGLTWAQVTPGVTNGATSSDAPGTFTAMPGDVVEIRVPVTTILRGDNLVADLTVTYLLDAGATGLASAGFHLEDDAGVQVAPRSGDTPAGGAVTLAGLAGTSTGVTATWTVVVTVNVLGTYEWVTPSAPGPAASLGVGTVTATLEQVRDVGGGS